MHLIKLKSLSSKKVLKSKEQRVPSGKLHGIKKYVLW